MLCPIGLRWASAIQETEDGVNISVPLFLRVGPRAGIFPNRRSFVPPTWLEDAPMTYARIVLASLLLASFAVASRGEDPLPWTRTEDVIYGRKHGVALTLDAFAPKEPNGAAVLFVVSGGWLSAHEFINAEVFAEFLRRGYTVFAVVHGSQPKYTIPEIAADLQRSVRFVRHHAAEYGVNPGRVAIAGGSAGGHLALLIGTSGRDGDPRAKDPVDRESSRVQAVGAYYPPTDFLNYGVPGRDVFKALEAELARFKAPFDFEEFDAASGRIRPVTDEAGRRRILAEISPITHVTSDDPPAIILQGDKDELVPLQQARSFADALESAGVSVELVVREGQGHGWGNWIEDMALLADWFDTHLELKE